MLVFLEFWAGFEWSWSCSLCVLHFVYQNFARAARVPVNNGVLVNENWFLRKANSELGVGWRLQKMVELRADAVASWNRD